MSKQNNLTVELSADTTLLVNKLNLLLELKTRFLQQGVHSVFLELFDLTFNSSINNSDICTCHCVTTTSTDETNKLVCVFDFSITNFIREWLIAMRTNDSDGLFHDVFSDCRGD